MDVLTILPPIAAIIIAAIWRNVYAALLIALFLSETLIASFNPGMGLLGVIDRNVSVFESAYNTRILLFCLVIGALIAFMRDSGGVSAMAQGLMKSGIASSKRRAELVVAATGSAIFLETNISLLGSGILGRSLYQTYKMSRERLAFIIDTTCAPISVLILLNGWGAYALGLVAVYEYDNPSQIVMGTIPFNVYALIAVAGVFLTAFSGKVFGPLKTADEQMVSVSESVIEPTKASYMWVPVVVMILGALGFMYWTGNGNITEGSGSQSILWALCLATAVVAFLLWIGKRFKAMELQDKAFKGIGEMVPMVTVLLLSIALGGSLKELGTGAFIAKIATGNVSGAMLPVLLFIAAGVTSFMTGTSWGTYGIMVPIAMPLAQALGIPPSLALAAVLGGGVFGDHCSPISDTSLIASVAAGCDHLSHVKTQLPYAMVFAGITSVVYLVLGFVFVG